MTSPDSPDPVERLHRALRDLPDVPAPRTLEDRVFAALAARAARPWWQQPVSAWPSAARIGLVGLSLAAATALTLLLQVGVRDSVEAAREIPTWFEPTINFWVGLRATGQAMAGVVSMVPTLWLYGLAAASVVTAAILGGGIAAYRSLCLRN